MLTVLPAKAPIVNCPSYPAALALWGFHCSLTA